MTITSQYAGKCIGCGARIEVGARIEWTRGVGARHLTEAECQRAVDAARAARAAAPVVATGSHLALASFLRAAHERGLKFPKARFLGPDGGEIRLSLAGARSAAPGSVNVVRGEDWLGRIEPDGRVMGRRLAGDAALLDTLLRIAEDPATAARNYGRMMARCSFCNQALTDDRSGSSVELGYGPVCARKWGLPHHPTGVRRELATVE